MFSLPALVCIGLLILILFPGARAKLFGTAAPGAMTIPNHPEWSAIVDKIIEKLELNYPLLTHEIAVAQHFRDQIVAKKLGIGPTLDRAIAAQAAPPASASPPKPAAAPAPAAPAA